MERKPAADKGAGLAASFHGGKQRGPTRGRVQRSDQGTQRGARRDTDGFGGYQSKANRGTGGKDSTAGDILSGLVCRKRRLDVLRSGPSRSLQARRRFYRKNSQGNQARRSPRRAAKEVRVHHQSESRQADRAEDSPERAGASG